MTKRRPLVEGLNDKKAELSQAEKNVIFGSENQKSNQETPAKITGRIPITVKVRSDVGAALKRASLQRQLDCVEPSTIQDIVDEALEKWLLKTNNL